MVVTKATEQRDPNLARARGQDLEDRSRGGDLGERRGAARRRRTPASSRRFSLRELAAKASATGGPIGAELVAEHGGRRRAASPRTSATSRSIRRRARSEILRYTAVQDVGPRHPSRLRRGPDPGRRGAGHRLGAERGVRLRRERASWITRASSTTACRWRSDLPMIDRSCSRSRTRSIRRACAASARCRSCRRWRRSPTRSTVPSAYRLTELPMSPPKVLAALTATAAK